LHAPHIFKIAVEITRKSVEYVIPTVLANPPYPDHKKRVKAIISPDYQKFSVEISHIFKGLVELVSRAARGLRGYLHRFPRFFK